MQRMKPMERRLAVHGVTDTDVQEAIESLWQALRTDPAAGKAMVEAGIDPALVVAISRPPFDAHAAQAQFGIASTILVSVTAGVLTHISKNSLDLLWDKVLWPRLRQRFGAKLGLVDDADPGR